jgi:uncharacterized repeat protein (TIGR02543 family)
MNTKIKNKALILVISSILITGVLVPMVNSQINDRWLPLPLDNTNWWNTSWPYRKLITIDHTKVNSSLINFPVIISRSSDSDLANNTQTSGQDITFILYSDNTTKLSHEIELYNHTNGNLITWVNVPYLSSTTETKLYLYYGNKNCANQQDKYNTWNSNYLMVHHMNDPGNIIDSTLNHLNGTNYGTIADIGQIGGCRYFDNLSDEYYFGTNTLLNPGMSSWTISLWIKISDTSNSYIIKKFANQYSEFDLNRYNNNNFFRTGDGTQTRTRYWTTDWRNSAWHLLNIVINRNTNKMDVYLDGALNSNNGMTTGNITGLGSISNTAPLYLLGGSNGRIDELRVETTVCDINWIKTCYNNQLNPSGFYQLSNEESYEYSVTTIISPIEAGTVTKSPAPPYYYNDSVTLTAIANPGYTFDHWTGDLNGSTNPMNITIDGDKAVTAYFTQNDYTLSVTIDPVEAGTVEESQTPPYHHNDNVTLTAIANPGYTFDYWTGDLNGSTNPVNITIDGDKAVTAHFTQNQYTLAITIEGQGNVSIDPDQSTYTYGTIVQLTAIPDVGWSFDHWSGNLTGSTNPTNITIDENKAVTAHFTQNQYTLTISIEGQGNVTEDPDQTTYIYGQVVTFTANASAGWVFDHWAGDLSGNQNPATITMNDNKIVIANFSITSGYTLSIIVEGSGTVIKEPDQPTYTYDQVVTLTANASAGWVFDHWTGDLSGNQNPTTITMDDNKNVIANFSITSGYTLTIIVEGSGTVIKDPDQPTYAYGQIVNLTAIPATGWSFNHWTGDLTGNQNPATITIDNNKNVIANFSNTSGYTLIITIEGSGTVTKDPDQSIYTYGQVVTLTANASAGWVFDHWANDLTGNQNPTTIIMNGNKTVIANFTQNQYTLTITIEGQGNVAKDPDQTTYAYGQIVNLTAIPAAEWSFNHWTGDLTGNTNPTNITMTENKNVIANFTQNQYILTITIEGQGTVTKDPDELWYPYGQIITLTAIAAPHWIFDHWGGDLTGNTNPTTITMDGNKSVIANFIFVNSPPVANDDYYNTSENTSLFVVAPGVLGNDTDSDGDLLTAVLVNGTQGGLTLRANGSFEYHPPLNYYGVVNFTYKAYDGATYSSIATVTINITKANNPPNKPIKPIGSVLGEISLEYSYNTTTTDPDDDQVYYQWNWGDGNISKWLGPYGSGEIATASHMWNTLGSYQIKVRAKDSHGLDTSWSDPLTISIFGPAILIGLIQDVNDSGEYITFKPDLVLAGVGSPLHFTFYWSGHMMILSTFEGFAGQRFIIGMFYTVVIPDQQTSKLFPLRDHLN